MPIRTTTNRDNAYRHYQKVNGASSWHRREDRVNVPAKTSHWYQANKNRLFIAHNAEQSAELKKLCGKAIKFISLAKVVFRRAHDPFMEEINLSK